MTQLSLQEPDLFGGLPPLPSSLAAPLEEPKHQDAFKTISETAEMLSLPAHVLRFWESQFRQLKPLKLKGGRRYYRPHDVNTLLTIKQLLYTQGYTIKGARKALAAAKKPKDIPMPQDKKTAPSMEDTPLFSALPPVTAHPASARKQALQGIYAELLELKSMLGKLEPLH